MGFAYVSNINSRDVSVIDTKNHSVVATARVDGFPQSIALSPDDKLVYVVFQNAISNSFGIKAIDTKTHYCYNSG
ncbi:hypothetical protein [Cytobacillus sp. IB215665]|uniref:hypothetical protein n=1 Tax=Cytobacillus sp. IB215665 TaxID=3097357 RepID=UPI002A0B00E1|nr:hypothetical protein [Cytobacillus sp. IB215665]MDX8367950.1 hypothetical protein [Cytobacillus sp. IB215665]